MGNLLVAVGLVWVAIGLAYIVTMAWHMEAEPIATIGLIFILMVFVLPGLVVAGIGSAVVQRKRDRQEKSEERAAAEEND